MSFGATSSTRKKSLIDQPNQKILVGVAGGSAAGKTTLCENIYRQMAFDRNFKVQIISLDSFYKNVDKTQVDIRQYNFDHPNAIDFDLAFKTLQSLIESNDPVPVPQYSFIQHARLKQPVYVGPANIIFFEGLMAFYDKRIRDLLTYKIFINCDDDIRLCRRLKRDTAERGRSVINILEQYNKFVKNAFRDFILPSIVYADIIIPGFRNNRVSVDFIVQHIKNIARRITFKERAIKTRTFIFGESEIYDLECTASYDTKVTVEQESFLVFPTSNQHKKELQFFLSQLLSQIFSVQYFHQIYINQFIKILKALLKQLIALKSFKSSQMQIFSVYNLQEILMLNCNKYPIKVILFPVAELQYSKSILSKVKTYIENNPKTTFILLNAFCDMTVPNMIYRFKLSNVIMINLFVIANDKRFKQIMTNNISANTDSFDWFVHNHDIANEGVEIISKQFNLYKRNQQQIAFACYDFEVSKQKQKMTFKEVDQTLQKVGIIQQYNVYCQEHQNLCGYHALSTLMCLQSSKSITSKQHFVQNYHLLANSIGKVDYQDLQRHNIPLLLSTKLLQHHQNIGVLIFSCKYIQNSQEQADDLQRLFDQLNSGQKPYIYVLLGVHDHYVLTKITKSSISYYDSNNISLRQIWNIIQPTQGSTPHPPSQGQQKPQDKDERIRKHNLKQALQILLDLMDPSRSVATILVEKRIEDIVGSFNLIKDNQAQIDSWLLNQYPKQVIENQLLKIMRERKLDLDEGHKKMLHEWLNHPKISILFHQNEKKLY